MLYIFVIETTTNSHVHGEPDEFDDPDATCDAVARVAELVREGDLLHVRQVAGWRRNSSLGGAQPVVRSTWTARRFNPDHVVSVYAMPVPEDTT